jgi:putative endonuclease
MNPPIYVGVTNNLGARLREHKEGRGSTFTARYGIDRLVYCHEFGEVRDAIAAEKRIKGWTRDRKVS